MTRGIKSNIKIKCPICFKVFKTVPSRIAKYCSWDCFLVSKELKLRNCKFCGKEFKPFNHRNIFCSSSCRSKYTMLGRKLPNEWKKAISQSEIGRINHNPHGRGRGGIRGDLGHNCRSTWEANFSRILNFLGIKYEYENQKYRIIFYDKDGNKICSFLPDFYLPNLNLFVEVKGQRFGDRGRKIELLYSQQPNFPIKIVDNESYDRLRYVFKDKIINWE